MEITIQHFDGKYPSFNIMLHGAAGADPFITIRGCRIVEGKNGPFVSYPATKNDQGKYWNHVVGGEKFNEAVLKKAQQSQRPSHDAAKARQLPQRDMTPRAAAQQMDSHGFEDVDDDIPF